MRNQLATIGTPDANNVGRRPYFPHAHPTTNVPIEPPTPNIDATQAISDSNSAPFSNGDSSDSRTKNAADVQPTAVPYAMVFKLAVKVYQLCCYKFRVIDKTNTLLIK